MRETCFWFVFFRLLLLLLLLLRGGVVFFFFFFYGEGNDWQWFAVASGFGGDCWQLHCLLAVAMVTMVQWQSVPP